MKEKLLISACLVGVNCKYSGGNNYCPAVEALKQRYEDRVPLLLKPIPNDTLRLRLESAETKRLRAGWVPYVYDIQITFADGSVDTFIDRAKFIVTEEVE